MKIAVIFGSTKHNNYVDQKKRNLMGQHGKFKMRIDLTNHINIFTN